ncbi:uncharacterized protein LOC113873518 [Abrus precatorius]|uniref:Uncharacterized protein LOC113873518 n=1 Tax=Abrus precatorius TaxID=3816 RepID=A0A8B8MHV2_ABRPR|nr:uncharacterized protein LOC113873518 [Abrus precatorius]
MEKNNDSNSSVCRKIRQALSGNTAVRAIQRISSFNQEPKPVTTSSNSPSPLTNISVQNQPLPHHKAHTGGSGVIPIKFDHSTAKSTNNGNKAVSSVPKDASEKATKVASKGEPQPHVPMQWKQQHGHGVEQPQGTKSMNINDIFDDFIQRTGNKLRTLSNIGRGQTNPVAAPEHEVHKNETNKDHHFSEFIQRAKKKLRTKTTVGKTSSLRKE